MKLKLSNYPKEYFSAINIHKYCNTIISKQSTKRFDTHG